MSSCNSVQYPDCSGDPFSGPHVRSYASEDEALEAFLEDYQSVVGGVVAPTQTSKRSVSVGAERPRLDYATHIYTGVSEEPISGHSWVLSLTDYGDGLVDCVAIRNVDFRSGGVSKGNERKSSRADMDPRVLAMSQMRARRRCRQKIIMLRADRMLTLTFREDLIDLGLAWKALGKWFRIVKRLMPDFAYVAVPEIQEKRAERTGKRVWHFHLAVRGFRNVNVLRHCWRRVVGEGNVDIGRGGAWKRGALARYLCKYMSKAFDTGAASRKRYSSAGCIPDPVRKRLYIPVGAADFLRAMRSVERYAGVRVVRSWSGVSEYSSFFFMWFSTY